MKVHTFEVTKSITRSKLRALATKCFNREEIESLINGSIKKLVNENTQDYGINRVSLYLSKDKKFFKISLVINPQSMIRQTATIELFDCSHRSKQMLDVAFATQMYPVMFPALSEWYIKRIDYTYDIVIPDNDEDGQSNKVALYVALLRKARRPAQFEDTGDNAGSLHTKSKSTTINFYDKQYQVECKLAHLSSYNRLHKEAENIIRIEIECYDSKLDTIKKKHHLPDTKVGTMLRQELSRQTILYYYYTVVGYGDYYSLPEASKMVQEAHGIRKDKAERFMLFLEMVSTCDNLNDAMEKLPRSTYNDRINTCKQLGINPITIPEQIGINQLVNPLPKELQLYSPQETVWTPLETFLT